MKLKEFKAEILRLCKKKVFILGIFSLLIIIFVLIYSDKSNMNEFKLSEKFLAPSFTHLFGTDQSGRDLFLRTVTGFRNTFLLALLIQLLAFIGGAVLGTFLGFYGNVFDEIFFHLANILLSFPSVLLAMFLSLTMGNGVLPLIIIFSTAGLIYNIKVVRAEIMQIKTFDFVLGLRFSEIKDIRIIFYHLLPRGFFILLPLLPIFIGNTMIGISSFAFLGIGIQPPTPELGLILKDSMRFVTNAPWLIILSGAFQFSCVLIFSIFSDSIERGLRYE